VLPEVCRNIATKLGAFYYETSVLEGFGVEEVFTNVLRAALINKRNRHFWMGLTSLKHVNRPSFQAPHPVPQPKPPNIKPFQLIVDIDFSALVDSDTFVDVIFLVQGVRVGAHAACLAISSQVFCDLLDISFSTSCTTEDMTTDCIRCCECISSGNSTTIRLDHVIFESVTRSNVLTDLFSPPVITLNNCVSPAAFHVILYFVYSGKLLPVSDTLCAELCCLADKVGLANLSLAVTNLSRNEDFMNLEIYQQFHNERCSQIKHLLLEKRKFAGEKFN